MMSKTAKLAERNRPLIVIPDANVLMHGKALADLPWAELGADPIEVRLVGPVIHDLDQVKNRPGRPAKVARAISGSVRDMIRSGSPEVIRVASPRVTKRLWMGVEVTGAVREGLDISHTDRAIINVGLWLLDQGENVILITDDNYAALMAQQFGMPVHLMPDHWRRGAEPDEAQKELARVQAENVRLRAAEPQLEAWFDAEDGERIAALDFSIKIYQPLDNKIVDRLIARVAHASPLVDVKASPAPKLVPPKPGPVDIATLSFEPVPRELWDQFDPVTQEQVDIYRRDYAKWLETVRSRLSGLHVDWMRRREWPTVEFVIRNSGSRPATETLVEIESAGDLLIERPAKISNQVGKIDAARKLSSLSLPKPPSPPTPGARMRAALQVKPGVLDAFGLRGAEAAVAGPLIPNLKREADGFYWRSGRRDPVTRMALECEMFRHQRDPERFAMRLFAPPASGAFKGVIVGAVNAANVSGPVIVRLPVRIRFDDGSVETIAEQMVTEFEREPRR